MVKKHFIESNFSSSAPAPTPISIWRYGFLAVLSHLALIWLSGSHVAILSLLISGLSGFLAVAGSLFTLHLPDYILYSDYT